MRFFCPPRASLVENVVGVMSGQSGSRSRSKRRILVRNRSTLEVQFGNCGDLFRGSVDAGGAVRVDDLVAVRKDRVRAKDELDW